MNKTRLSHALRCHTGKVDSNNTANCLAIVLYHRSDIAQINLRTN